MAKAEGGGELQQGLVKNRDFRVRPLTYGCPFLPLEVRATYILRKNTTSGDSWNLLAIQQFLP